MVPILSKKVILNGHNGHKMENLDCKERRFLQPPLVDWDNVVILKSENRGGVTDEC